MKRVLALVLALVMVLAPMSAFATTSNSVNKVPKVADNHAFTSDAPVLRIEEKNIGEFGGVNQVIRLELENAEWTDAMFNTISDTDGDIYFTKITNSTVQATVYDADTTNKGIWEIPMLAEVSGAGEVKVTVDPRDSAVSGGTYTFAVAADGSTIATVGSVKTVTRKTNEVGATIVIDETNIGALSGTQSLKLRLPKNFVWNDNTVVRGLDGNAVSISSGNIDGRYLEVDINADLGDTSRRRSITVVPHIDVTRDATHGEVVVDIIGKDDIATEYGLHVANYKDYGVTVEIEEVEEFFAGRLDNDYVTAKITIKEVTENSLFDGRTIDFELPDWVKLQYDEFTQANITSKGTTLPSNSLYIDEYGSKFELTVPRSASVTTKETFEFKLPLTIKADKAGEVVLTVKGAGIEEQELVIAEAIKPVTADINVADVRIGLQEQGAPDIIIEETEAGALKEANLDIWFADKDYGFRFDDAIVEVIDGDLEFDEDNAGVEDDYTLRIPVTAESTKASTIKISGIKLTLDRNVPEGPFSIRVGGTAVVENYTKDVDQNGTDDDNDYYTKHFTSRVAQETFANVVTRAGGVVASQATFVIGEATYTVLLNGQNVEKLMDTAAFIENGRTMLPVRYVAEALGVSDANIIWNAEARTVTIFKDARVIQLTIDSNVMMVNGVEVAMDSPAIIREGRTFLPIRFVAQALNAEILWDAATRTVTINQ